MIEVFEKVDYANAAEGKDISDEWLYLEGLRRSGYTNMFGAVPYLINEFGISHDDARYILNDWMNHYDTNDYLS